MIICLDTIILCCIDEVILQTPPLLSDQCISSSAYRCEFDSNQLKSINHNNNAVTMLKYMYDSSKNAICFQYAHKKDRQYRFNFSNPLIKAFFICQHEVIKLKKNNSLINLQNLVLSFLIQSNHDINFLFTKMKTLAIIYYITNYSTKGNCSQYQYIIFIAIIRKA